jgi:hypothetical protein
MRSRSLRRKRNIDLIAKLRNSNPLFWLPEPAHPT